MRTFERTLRAGSTTRGVQLHGLHSPAVPTSILRRTYLGVHGPAIQPSLVPGPTSRARSLVVPGVLSPGSHADVVLSQDRAPTSGAELAR